MSAARTQDRETDDQLMCRVKVDDVDAFSCLYERYSARALRVARAVCPDSASAEEAVQEGFLSIWQNRSGYQSASGSFAGWAMVIVRHRAIDANRREAARPRSAASPPVLPAPADPVSPCDAAIASEHAAALRAALRALPDTQAEVIALAFFGQLSHGEIARVLGLPTGTVKGRMRLGLHRLRDGLPEGNP